MEILIKPIITEKSMQDASGGKYHFEVHSDTNKKEIEKAVNKYYKVNVEFVNIINNKPKQRKYRARQTGWSKAWKKAIVTLKNGQSIKDFEVIQKEIEKAHKGEAESSDKK